MSGDLSLLGYSEVKVPDLLFLLSMLRGYHLLRLLYWMLPIEDARSQFYCHLQGISNEIGFYMRRALLSNVLTLVAVWGIISLYCALCLFIFERADSKAMIQTFWDSIWAVIMTEELVGAKDIIPATDVGRLVFFVAVLVGIVTLSMLLRVIEGKLRMTKGEEHFAAEFLYHRLRGDKLKPAAASFIQKCWRLKTRKKGLWSFMRAFHLFAFWRGYMDSRRKSGWDLERRGKNWQFSFALTRSQLILLPEINKSVRDR